VSVQSGRGRGDAIESGRTSRESGDEDDSVDDMRKDLDSGSLDTDDPGRGRGVTGAGEKARVIGRDDEGHPGEGEKMSMATRREF
jgi:hypothetical protein